MRRLWLAPAAGLLAAWCCGAAESYRVAGTIVNSETGAPLTRAQIEVTKAGSSVAVTRQVTGTDGRFSFDLPQGKYDLHGGPRDTLEMYGRRAADNTVASAVITGPGQDTANLIFKWFPTGGISGKIVDENGEPVENALVQLVRSTVTVGQRVTNTFAWARSDDRGEYRFGRLVASTYYLAVTGRPWYATAVGYATETNPSAVAFRPVYYPNSLDKRHAGSLRLKSGEEYRADFTLQTVLGGTLKITYENPQGLSGNVGLVMDGIGASDGFERQETILPGSQIFSAVPTGHYLVHIVGTQNGAPVFVNQPVDVGGGDLQIKVSPLPAPDVTGTIQMKNATMRPRGTVVVRLLNISTRAISPAAMHSDGTFSFPRVTPGKYRILLAGADGYFASEIRVEGAEYRNGVVDLTAGSATVLHIVASDQTGRVEGFAMRNGQPAEGMLVLLAPQSDEPTALQAHGFQTDSDGSFDYRDIPAGDYFLFAVADSQIEYADREAIRRYFAGATRVHLEAHGSVSERIETTTPIR